MNPDIFESIMLVCFGCAWPLSIYKTWKTKTSRGKSLFFLTVILIGYISGILFEIYGDLNFVIYLYLINILMVVADLVLSIKYRNN
jgi:hypothetical protein